MYRDSYLVLKAGILSGGLPIKPRVPVLIMLRKLFSTTQYFCGFWINNNNNNKKKTNKFTKNCRLDRRANNDDNTAAVTYFISNRKQFRLVSNPGPLKYDTLSILPLL
ncbi:hypothetical protein OUZ56_031222 [Daphnia magna]|uniref:Uncharacterized protein n=1 Tax=Daphnia magna TaxID=35525 RepID=A0ABQ9ZTM3_9CRUS|nr:hypothetical protein OUZ56_031222 [Daphnia magna]